MADAQGAQQACSNTSLHPSGILIAGSFIAMNNSGCEVTEKSPNHQAVRHKSVQGIPERAETGLTISPVSVLTSLH
jgi:hypothetical protein